MTATSKSLSPHALDLRWRAAEAIVRDAGLLARRYFYDRASLVTKYKGTQDVVSLADQATETLIRERISALFPDDAFLGEEGGLVTGATNSSSAIWIVDPIDGTDCFLRGVPIWCVSIGFAIDGQPTIGVIYDPVADELFSARTGAGCFRNGVQVKVSAAQEVGRARIALGFSYRRPLAPHLRMIEGLLSAHCEYSRMGSGALGLAHTADGRFEGYWEAHINSWDALAGIVLVREAGGHATNILEGDGLLKGAEILAVAPQFRTFLEEKARLAFKA